MEISIVDDKDKLASFLSRQPALNAYLLGDLDERYWGNTRWFALEQQGEIKEVALLYFGMETPILIAIENADSENLNLLLDGILDDLPDNIYAHLSAGQYKVLKESYQQDSHGMHYIMELQDESRIINFDTQSVQRVGHDDFEQVLALFDLAYPGHWFERKMLDFGPYFAIADKDGNFLSVGGVHVYSEKFKVATIGNVVTHLNAQGKGYSQRVSARLCQELMKSVETIGLNVHANNQAAFHLYKKLGFRKIAEYEEMTLHKI